MEEGAGVDMVVGDRKAEAGSHKTTVTTEMRSLMAMIMGLRCMALAMEMGTFLKLREGGLLIDMTFIICIVGTELS